MPEAAMQHLGPRCGTFRSRKYLNRFGKQTNYILSITGPALDLLRFGGNCLHRYW